MINSNKLKGIIREKGETQCSVAKKLGIAQTSLTLKINNKRAFSLDEANKISEILHLSQSDFKSIFFA